MPLDPNEAPDGHLAVECANMPDPCSACVFGSVPRHEFCKACETCSPWERSDGAAVIFVKRPEAQVAHAAVAEPKITHPALVGLSDEQIMHLWFAAEPTEDGRPASWNYARAIERALAAANGMTLREPSNG